MRWEGGDRHRAEVREGLASAAGEEKKEQEEGLHLLHFLLSLNFLQSGSQHHTGQPIDVLLLYIMWQRSLAAFHSRCLHVLTARYPFLTLKT